MIPCTFSGNGSSASALRLGDQTRELLCVERIPACAREQRHLQIGRKDGSIEQAGKQTAVSSSESGETDK